MRRRLTWSALYRVFQAAQWISMASAIGVGAILKTEPHKWDIVLDEAFTWIQHSAWWLVIVFGAVTFVSKATCAWIGPPWVWKVVQSVLDRFREEAFDVPDDAGTHEYRVTLFRHDRFVLFLWPWRSWYWPWGPRRHPWSGWLVPVVRSGHTTQHTNVVFLAPDDADNAEGVAGRAWATGNVAEVRNLPAVGSGAMEQEINDFAKDAHVTVEWVRARIRKGKPFPRSLCAIPVESGDGKLWGVIVLDSRTAGAIKYQGHVFNAYVEVVPFFLSQILKRV